MAKQRVEMRRALANRAAQAATGGSTLTRAGQTHENTRRVDSQLIVQIGQHDEQALGKLYDRYGVLVYTIALRITQDRALAESIVLDVFHAVWQSARSFQIGANLPIWLLGLARRQASEAAQPRSARMGLHREIYPEKHTIRDDTHSEYSVDLFTVPHLLDALPTDQRETLELAYYEGLTCREIATRLHEPVATIKARLRIGLCAFSEALSNAAAHLGEQNL